MNDWGGFIISDKEVVFAKIHENISIIPIAKVKLQEVLNVA